MKGGRQVVAKPGPGNEAGLEAGLAAALGRQPAHEALAVLGLEAAHLQRRHVDAVVCAAGRVGHAAAEGTLAVQDRHPHGRGCVAQDHQREQGSGGTATDDEDMHE